MRHYDALVAQAAIVGWPLAYRRDLDVHDRQLCERLDEATPFLWVLRDAGTHLWVPGGELAALEDVGQVERYLLSLQAAMGPLRLYWWDGRQLCELDSAEEACLLYEDRLRDVRAARRAAERAA